jgi:hypothetical protein
MHSYFMSVTDPMVFLRVSVDDRLKTHILLDAVKSHETNEMSLRETSRTLDFPTKLNTCWSLMYLSFHEM